ncbi:MAG: hypothetical protein HY290_25860 [Planctomycetia bacterium]|nr:hypothetical protein [Planctomycetia bacterium]
MKLIDLNRNPTNTQLRQFGLACLVFLPLIGWLTTGRPLTLEAANVPLLAGLAAFGLVVTIVALVWPRAVKPLFIGASLAAFPIGLVVGELAMLLVFFLVFTPMALIFRLIGRDALQRKVDRQAKSYWQPKAQPKGAASYYRLY